MTAVPVWVDIAPGGNVCGYGRTLSGSLGMLGLLGGGGTVILCCISIRLVCFHKL